MFEFSAVIVVAGMVLGQAAIQSRPLDPIAVEDAQPSGASQADPRSQQDQTQMVKQEIRPFGEVFEEHGTPPPPVEFLDAAPSEEEEGVTPAPVPDPAPAPEPEVAPPPAPAPPPAQRPAATPDRSAEGGRVAAFWMIVPGL